MLLDEWDTGLAPDSDEPAQQGDAPPTVSSFTVEEESQRLRFRFQVSDPDGDLGGGEVTVTVGQTPHTFAYPSEVNVGANGAANVTVSTEGLDRDRSYPCSLVVRDRASHGSETLTTSLSLGPWETVVDEVGDTPADVAGVGRVELPALVRGDIYRAANAAGDYAADIDVVKFAVPETGTYNFVLEWTAGGADYDLFLMDGGLTTLDSSVQQGAVQPEFTSARLQAGVDYYFAVGGWSGPGGDWTVRIE